MKTIAQILLSAALSAGMTLGFSSNAREQAAGVIQRAESFVSQTTDSAAQSMTQAASNTALNTDVQVSTEAGAQNAGADTRTQSSAESSGTVGDGSLFDFLFDGGSGLNLNLGFGR